MEQGDPPVERFLNGLFTGDRKGGLADLLRRSAGFLLFFWASAIDAEVRVRRIIKTKRVERLIMI
ncbi:MAG: hypothetical protein MPW15_10485 [Candidatus Manganitrophus sp.]|nr:hypothetical protein [Candidatus Manganitrophus sp.]